MAKKARPSTDEKDESEAAPTPKLQPLACRACGGPVPLVDGAVVACPYCQQPVPIPPDYQALRLADRQRTQAESAMGQAYERLGQPPSPLLRFWGGNAGKAVQVTWKIITGFLGIWVFLLRVGWEFLSELDDWRIAGAVLLLPFGALYGVLWLTARFVHFLAVPLGIDLVDVLSLAWTFLGLGGLLLLVVALPKVVFEYLESFAHVRRQLQACLAARPPRTPGGPAMCRSCGAALTIPTGALGVRCAYCQTDNLVALPTRWISRVKDRSHTFYHQVAAAELAEDTARRTARSTAALTVLVALVLPVIACGCGWTMVHLHLLEERINWRIEVAGPRELLPHSCTVFDDCSGDKPGVFDLAIRRGDTVELEYKGKTVPSSLLVRHMNSRKPVRVSWDESADSVTGRVVVKASGWLVLDGAGAKDRWQIRVRPTREKLLPIE